MNSNFPPNNIDESEEDSFYQLFLEEQNRRNENLIKFIDEFVTSQEYNEYLEMKQNIVRKSISVQYSEGDLTKYQTHEEKNEYPLTTQSKKMLAFINRFEKYTKNRENLEILRKQEKGIQIIKDKIVEVRRAYICTNQIRDEAKRKRDEKNLEEICQSYNIDHRIWKDGKNNKITQRILCYQKILHSQKVKKKQNVTAIVRKLVEEMRYKRGIEHSLKSFSPDVQKSEKIMRNMEVVGHHITLFSRLVEDDVNKAIDIENIIEKSREEIVEDKKVKQKKEKVTKGKKAKKEAKNSKTTKSSKKSQKSKNAESEIIIPKVPICNDRHIITTEHIEKIDELINTFNKLDDIMEDKHLLAQISPIKFTTTDVFLCKPQSITFNNFMNGNKYRKNLVILNKSRGTQKLRLVGISSDQDYNVLLFKTQPLLGIQKLASGCSVMITVFFAPIEEIGEVEATLEFWTFDTISQKNETFHVHIKCIPSHADLKMSSNEIYFGKIPFWQRMNNHFKILKLENKGKKPCTVVFRKIQDLLELPETEENGEHIDENNFDDEVIEDIEKNYIVNEVIEEVVDNVFNTFSFEHLAMNLANSQIINLKIRMKNIDYVGNYLEKYLVNVYEDSSLVGNKELVIYAEVTEHFITVSPEILDFGVCILNSIYQLALDINNNSSTTQAIAIKFPTSLVDFIRSDVANIYVPAKATRKIWLKLLPRKPLISDSERHYDKQTAILEFPVHICTMSKNYIQIPPVKARVFAVLTETNNIALSAKTKDFRNKAIVNLGECSIYETICTDIVIENKTFSPQIYGFVNLPQNVTLSPNFGYGTIEPEKTKILKISYYPDINDVKKFFSEGKLDNLEVKFDIQLDTVSNLGQIKHELCTKKLRRSIDITLKELIRAPLEQDTLFQNIMALKDSVRTEYYPETDECGYDINERLHEYEMEIANEYYSEANFFRKHAYPKSGTDKNMISIRARIIRPLLELSCQYVELPDTPCGSYSFVEIELEALKSEFTLECDFLNKSSATLPSYEAWFKIMGDNEELRIEPSCGTLRNGEKTKLILVAKPVIPQNIIQDTARSIKYTEIYEKRKQDIMLRKLKSKSKKKLKDTKRKNKEETETKAKLKKQSKLKTKGKKSDMSKSKYTEESNPKIDIRESDIILDYLDYYPAEMCYWRTLQPYTVQSKFVCSIDYYSTSMFRKQETLYLDASVRVVRPDFITNLKTQRINFGNVAIGMGNTQYIILQNIQYNFISPKTSLLNPVGPFRIPHMRDMRIPPEHYLKLPVIFEPVENKQVEEYFEVTSGGTILSLILEGMGVFPEIEFKPNNSVFRLESSKNKIAQCNLQIINKTSASLVINFEKCVELEGFFTDDNQTKLQIDEKKDNVDHEIKKNKKKSQKGEKDKRKKTKIEASPNSLTEADKISISSNFVRNEGTFFFDILNIQENQVDIKENASTSIRIGFGTTEALLKMKKEIGKKGKRNKSPSEKKSTQSSKHSKKSADKKYYLVKYNIKLGNSFLRDIILICSVKLK